MSEKENNPKIEAARHSGKTSVKNAIDVKRLTQIKEGQPPQPINLMEQSSLEKRLEKKYYGITRPRITLPNLPQKAYTETTAQVEISDESPDVE